jgi:hypothetical protein
VMICPPKAAIGRTLRQVRTTRLPAESHAPCDTTFPQQVFRRPVPIESSFLPDSIGLG